MMNPVDTALLDGAREACRHRTPDQILGPYFPTAKQPLARADLTRRSDHGGLAQGEIIEIRGHVLNVRGEPVPGAKLTIWQANAFGRYAHANDSNPAPLDPNFVGCATIRSDDTGRYAIRTIKPGSYPAAANWTRPPHIHFEVEGQFERLVTQMYFPDETLNANDRLLTSALRPDLLIARPAASTQPSTHRALNFDIVLTRG
jgi:protocatechuate 3,4-dioxygenase, beta subunit